MVREENGDKNFEAGLDFIMRLRSLNYNLPVFVFCGHDSKNRFHQKTSDQRNKYGVIYIESDFKKCTKFASFKTEDEV